MSQATVRLLQAASDIVGGQGALAEHLNITDLLLQAYIEERRPLPDFLLLRTVDIVLEHANKHPLKAASQVLEEATRFLKSGSTGSS